MWDVIICPRSWLWGLVCQTQSSGAGTSNYSPHLWDVITCPYPWFLGPGCQKQVSKAGPSNCTPQYLWDVTTCPCPWFWGLVCQKHVSRAGTSNYIPHYLWDVITYPCPLIHVVCFWDTNLQIRCTLNTDRLCDHFTIDSSMFTNHLSIWNIAKQPILLSKTAGVCERRKLYRKNAPRLDTYVHWCRHTFPFDQTNKGRRQAVEWNTMMASDRRKCPEVNLWNHSLLIHRQIRYVMIDALSACLNPASFRSIVFDGDKIVIFISVYYSSGWVSVTQDVIHYFETWTKLPQVWRIHLSNAFSCEKNWNFIHIAQESNWW